MLDLIINIVITIGLLSAIALIIKEKRDKKQLYNHLAQLLIEKQILLDRLAEAFRIIEEKPVEQTDGFVKFLEESRNNAFEFIDTIQKAMTVFDDETKNIFAKDRLSADLKQIKQKYQELKAKILPTDTPNN